MSTSIPASIQTSKRPLWLGFLLTPFLFPLTIALFFVIERVYRDPWSITWHSVEHFITGDFQPIMIYGLCFSFSTNMLIALIAWRIKPFIFDGLNVGLAYIAVLTVLSLFYFPLTLIFSLFYLELIIWPVMVVVITLVIGGVMGLGFCWITGLPFAHSTANSAKR
jgi:hypothetical protein